MSWVYRNNRRWLYYDSPSVCSHEFVVHGGPGVVLCQDCGEDIPTGGDDCTVEYIDDNE